VWVCVGVGVCRCGCVYRKHVPATVLQDMGRTCMRCTCVRTLPILMFRSFLPCHHAKAFSLHSYLHTRANTYAHTERKILHSYLHTRAHTHTHRERERQTGRWADRQTERHTHRETERLCILADVPLPPPPHTHRYYGATNLRSAERFDAATNEWVTLPNMQVSVGLFVVHAGLFCLTEGVLVV
jgi:hypothetical protein